MIHFFIAWVSLRAWQRALGRRVGPVEWVLALAVFAAAWVTVWLLTPGVVARLTPGWVETFGLLSLGVFLAVTKEPGPGWLRRPRGGPGGRPRAAGPTWGAWVEVFRSPATCAALGLSLAVVAAVALLGLITPPAGFDDLSYHLLLPATWLQEGRLAPFPAYGLLHYWTYYPGQGELLYLWFLLQRLERVVDLVPLGFALLGGTAVYGISRTLGATRPTSVLAGTAFLLTPVVIIQAKSNYVDVILAALYLTAAFFLARSQTAQPAAGRTPAREPVAAWLLPAGLAAGMMLGTKGTGPLLLFLLLFLLPGSAARNRSVGKLVLNLGAFLGPAVLLGGYWYLRNWWLTGNPAYPFGLDLPLLPGLPGFFRTRDYLHAGEGLFVRRPSQWWLYPLVDHPLDVPGYNIGSGFGPQLLAFALPALLLVAAFGVPRRRMAGFAWRWWLQIPALVAVFALQPFKEPRYLLPAVGVAATAIGPALDRLPGKARELVAWVLVAGLAFSAFGAIPGIVPAGNLDALREFRDRRAVLGSHQLYALGWGAMGRAWLAVDRETSAGGTVGYDGLSLPYPLFGSRLQNRVVYLEGAAEAGGAAEGVDLLYLTSDSRWWEGVYRDCARFAPVYVEHDRRTGTFYGVFRASGKGPTPRQAPSDPPLSEPLPVDPRVVGPPELPGWAGAAAIVFGVLVLAGAALPAASLAAGVAGVLRSTSRPSRHLAGRRPPGRADRAAVGLAYAVVAALLLRAYIFNHAELLELAARWWRAALGTG